MSKRFLAGCMYLMGCAPPSDVQIRNPLLSRGLDANTIEKLHESTEQRNGLPSGAMSDRAALVSMDASKMCFSVVLHELGPIDLRTARFKLVTSQAELENAQVWAERPTSRPYGGVRVYETRGNICFDNRGAATADTRQIALEMYSQAPATIFRWGFQKKVN